LDKHAWREAEQGIGILGGSASRQYSGRPELVGLLRERIRADGPMTFAKLMEAALYEPGLGYYASPATTEEGKPTWLADFQTSPQVHPAFGWLVARELARVWDALGRPDPFVVVELGAGAGELAEQIQASWAKEASGGALEYHCVERRIETLSASNGRIQGREWPGPVRSHRSWWSDLAAIARAGIRAHCVLSNEFFDALPVHRVAWLGGALREVFVDWTGDGFVERFGEPSSPALVARLREMGLVFPEGWRGEICLRLDPVVAAVAALIDRGVVLTIDYGVDPANPERRDTLVAYHRHHWSDDVFHRVGEQDLTSHVDFDALLRIGRVHGLEPAGSTTQREFLLGHGLAEEAERWVEVETSPARQWQARFAQAELVRPDGLGRLRVVAQQKRVPGYNLAHGC